MKINDAISAYDFLGKLDWFGIIGLTLIIVLIVVFFVAGISDKLFTDNQTKQIIALVAIILVVVGIVILKLEADRNNTYLARANNIKTYMLENNEPVVGYKELSFNTDFGGDSSCDIKDKNCAKCVLRRTLEMQDVITRFPDDFAQTDIESEVEMKDNMGVALINEKVLNLFAAKYEKLFPLFKEKILAYMKNSKQDTLNYKFIINNIDTRCSNNVLDMLVSKNSGLFIAIYAPYNRYDKTSKDQEYTDALEINPDSTFYIFGRKAK